jgi:hypothetical protein
MPSARRTGSPRAGSDRVVTGRVGRATSGSGVYACVLPSQDKQKRAAFEAEGEDGGEDGGEGEGEDGGKKGKKGGKVRGTRAIRRASPLATYPHTIPCHPLLALPVPSHSSSPSLATPPGGQGGRRAQVQRRSGAGAQEGAVRQDRDHPGLQLAVPLNHPGAHKESRQHKGQTTCQATGMERCTCPLYLAGTGVQGLRCAGQRCSGWPRARRHPRSS